MDVTYLQCRGCMIGECLDLRLKERLHCAIRDIAFKFNIKFETSDITD
jgi:hypothetical protein